MMRVRLAMEYDREAVLAMGRANCAASYKHVVWDDETANATYDASMAHGTPTIWVVERDGVPVGLMQAQICGYTFAASVFTELDVVYVSPDVRGTRAAVLLMKELEAWSRRIGAVDIIASYDNGLHHVRTHRFFEHLGFQTVGHQTRKVLSDG